MDQGDPDNAGNDDDADDDDGDIEAQIKKEVEGMKSSKRANNSPLQIIKSDVQCGKYLMYEKNSSIPSVTASSIYAAPASVEE